MKRGQDARTSEPVVTPDRPITAGVLDSHVHFWDPGRLEYPWLAGIPELNRPFRPDDLAGGAEAVIVVQADCRWDQVADEVAWFQSLAGQGAPIRGIVAALPLELGPGPATIAALARQPLVVGVRRLLQDEPPGFALQPQFVAGVRQLGEAGLTFDLCVRHHQLPEVTALAERCPEVTFVLDHLGKPEVAAGRRSPWGGDLTRLAALPNVRCKLSGLSSEADESTRTLEHIGPFLRHAVEVFGPDRCLFGTDWPVAGLTISPRGWFDLVVAALPDLTEAEHEMIMSGTATAVYCPPGRPGRPDRADDQTMGRS